ncbi:MAG: tripartite tricarboxylate transporter receptor protein [Ahrensia sp.]|nr:tripartite tricarboxylate transporter receptor protein [Ahrensia sp.]
MKKMFSGVEGGPSRMRRMLLGAATIAAIAPALFGGVAGAQAQDYPTKPIRIIVPFGPGGLADITMRLAGEKLAGILGQQFVVENHPGAGGVAAANELLKSDPDGYDLIVMSNGTTIATSLFKNLGYDPQTQFTPISTLAWFDLGVFANPEGDYMTLDDFIAKAKAEPGYLNVATVNPGSSQNLAAEYFRKVAGIDVNIVTYRTSPDILAALIRGEVDVAIESPTAFSGALENNQARLLAVTGSQRNSTYPDVPTAQEAGVEGYEVVGWNALYTLAGTPDDIVKKLNDAMFEVAGMPEIQKRFMELGTSAKALTPDEMAAQFEKDRARWAEVIESAGIEKR